MQTLHIHFSPYSSRFSQLLMCPGSEFQIIEPSGVKLFVPKVVWFGLGVFKLYVVAERVMICLMY